MDDINVVTLTARLTKDVELKYTPKGTAVANISCALTNSVKVGEEWRDEPCFFELVTWGRQAEVCKEYAYKGSPIIINGKLAMDSWETKEGEKRTKLKIKAEEIRFIGGKAKVESKPSKEDAPTEPMHVPFEDSSVPF